MRTFTQNPNDPTFFTENETGAIFITRPGQSIESLLDEIANPPAPAPVVPDVVSSRQFFLQLATAGLTSQVEAWVAQQDPLVQIAFNKSATFRRDDEMLQQGFSGLGFTVEQVDQFFTIAARF